MSGSLILVRIFPDQYEQDPADPVYALPLWRVFWRDRHLRQPLSLVITGKGTSKQSG